jgi:hypothetical protein
MLVTGGAHAITVTIDGISSPTLLSDAVDTCMTAGAGPHVINITTDQLATADRQVVITQPITINGDADNDGIPCDILVDMTGIRNGIDAGINGYKSYIEIQAAGLVDINSINIHPNADGAYANLDNSPVNNVSGIRVFRPVLAADTCTYNFRNVGVSGSDANNSYLSLGTANDLFSTAGVKRWSGLGGDAAGEGNHIKHAALHYAEDALIGAGSIVSTVDHCEMGLSKGCAVSIATSNTVVQILGGVFGHCARDGIRIEDGGELTVQGTASDRVRVVRSANVSGGNVHSIEVVGGTVPLIEYVDVAGESTANGLALRDGTVNTINYFRSLGKFPETSPNNHGIIIASGNMNVGFITNTTVHGVGTPIGDPLGINAAVTNPVVIQDTIFTTSRLDETINVGSITTGIVEFIHCALPTDGVVNESMANPPITGPGATAEAAIILDDPIYVSPQYLLTLADYDWSDTQGADNPLNGAGNHNVLRPSNEAYLTAASNGGVLTGGAGPVLASIDAGTWMLME